MGRRGQPRLISGHQSGIPDVSDGPPDVSDMPPEDLRRHAHEAADWIADYLQGVGSFPVLPSVEPGDVRRALPDKAPTEGEPFEALMEEFRSKILAGVTHWNHPAFFAYFPTTGSGPGILGEMLAAALNVNAMVWKTSPAATELEELALDWVRELVGLPDEFRGTINDTASSSSLNALAAARDAAFPDVRERGLFGAPAGRIYASEEAHLSIDKAAMVLGFGLDGVRRVETDGEYKMIPDVLAAAIAEDVANGVRPVAVVATLGTTSGSSVDPVDAIADIAADVGLWLHVDAAYAGPAAIVPELRHHFAGWERADSVVINPHKWLFTPIDCSILYCRRPAQLRRAFSLTPEYLQTAEQGSATNLMDYGVALGRRFRALKLWFVLRYFGSEGIVERLREHCRLAQEFSGRVEREDGWELVAPVPFSTVAFRFCKTGARGGTAVPTEAQRESGGERDFDGDLEGEAQDRVNLEILDRVNESGEAFLSHTRLGGRIALRLSVGNLRTTEDHVLRAWELLQDAARSVA